MSVWSSTGLGAVSSGELYTTILPKFPRAVGTMPGVIYAHGNTSNATSAIGPDVGPVVQAIADAGYPVLSGDWGGTSTWGNDTTIARITTGRAYMQASMGARAGKVILVGGSAGGAGVLAWAAANPTLVQCIVGLLPVSDVDDIFTHNRAGIASNISSCYSGGWTQATYGATHNPVTMAAAGKFAGMPMRLFYGTTDTTVIPSTVQALAASVGSTAIISSVPGDHVGTTFQAIDAPTVVAFIRANS